MGLFSSVAGIFGGGDDSASQAAAVQAQALREAKKTVEKQLAQTRSDLLPFAEAGQEGFDQFVRGSTIGGFSQNLDDIFSSGSLQPLIDERTRAAQSQLAAGGLTRSGAGVQEIAAIPQDIGLAIEQLLSGRQGQLGSIGVDTLTNLGAFGQQGAQTIAGIHGNIGATQASGVLGQAQADAARKEQIFGGLDSLASTAASLFTPAGGGGGAGNIASFFL